jgi:hypothetical protein
VRNFVIFIVLSVLSNYAISEDLLIEKYSAGEKLDSIQGLYEKLCNKVGNVSECQFKPNTQIKWGLGFCENSPVELKKRIESTNPKIFVDLKLVSKNLISEQDEYYEWSEYKYCHTWSVKLSNWKAGKIITISTLDGNQFIDGARTCVSKN